MKAYIDAIRKLRDSAPKILINSGIIVLIWAFTKYVFTPLSVEYVLLGIPLPQLIGIVMLTAVSLLIIGIAREVFNLIDATSTYLAYTISARNGEISEDEISNYKRGFRGIATVLIVVIFFLLFKEFLNMLHPLLSSVVLLGIAIWSIVQLVNSGKAFSTLAEYYARQWAEQLQSRLQPEEG